MAEQNCQTDETECQHMRQEECQNLHQQVPMLGTTGGKVIAAAQRRTNPPMSSHFLFPWPIHCMGRRYAKTGQPFLKNTLRSTLAETARENDDGCMAIADPRSRLHQLRCINIMQWTMDKEMGAKDAKDSRQLVRGIWERCQAFHALQEFFVTILEEVWQNKASGLSGEVGTNPSAR